MPALAEAGFFAVAPNQRGYSAGARPDPADFARYDIELLIGDALDIVAAVGHGARRFHLVGHDWGGSLAWEIAARHPERLGSLTMLSRPHPTPSAGRCAKTRSSRTARATTRRSSIGAAAAAARGGRQMAARRAMPPKGCRPRRPTKHLSVLGDPAAMEAALAWYRARGTVHRPIGPVEVPTLFLWGDADDTVGRMAAEGTRDFVRAPYRFEVLPGVGHYAPDQVPERVNALLLEHLARHPA